MQNKGKFTLFDVNEFDHWLLENEFSRKITLIQNHHTYQPSYNNFKGNNHFTLLENMHNFHVQERKFSEIAQNLTTFPDGTIAVCRSMNIIPAGIKGANEGAVCIEHIGNFDIDGDTMLDAQKDTILRLNVLLCKKFSLTPDSRTIVYHHWYDLTSGKRTNGTGDTKSCPGTNFFGGNSVEASEANFLPLIIGLFFGLAKAGPNIPAATPETAKVTAFSLNVRSGHDVSSPTVEVLQKGTTVKVYEESDDWCKIHPTEERWVSRTYLHFL